MPNDAASELAKNITRNVVPLDAGQSVAGMYQPAENMVLRILQQLGLTPQAKGYTPQLNEPLPQRDPRTGQMIYPQGYKGPR